MKSVVAVTGGCGFIGAGFIRKLTASRTRVVNIDLLTYAGDEQRLADLPSGSILTAQLDICSDDIEPLLKEHRPATLYHFAAQTHVTRSEVDPDLFFRVNVEGTRRVLEAAEAAGVGRFVHVSTDEIYGPCIGDPFKEEDHPGGEGKATSAYARSKALADDLAAQHTGSVEVVRVRPTNSYGPWQYPEKAIARWTTRALEGEDLPVWGDGKQMRDWMFVDDTCEGIFLAGEEGVAGEAYNVGPGNEGPANVEIARAVAREAGRDQDAVYLTAYDRPDHDRRYAVDSSKLGALGWTPRVPLEEGLAMTVDWYRSNGSWWRPLLPEAESIYRDKDRASSS